MIFVKIFVSYIVLTLLFFIFMFAIDQFLVPRLGEKNRFRLWWKRHVICNCDED